MSANKPTRLRDLFAMEQLAPIELIKNLQKDGLIANSMFCQRCNKDMQLSSRAEATDKFSWRCPKCSSRKSVRAGSWFAESHLLMTKALQLTYMWVAGFRNKDVIRELDVSTTTTVDWFNFCREVCIEILLESEKEKIGGPGKFVDIDESKFGKRKFHRGKHDEGHWVLGGIERDTGKCFLEVVENRSSQSLIASIQNNIKDGTTIISDCWKASNVLGKMDYEHLTVNNSIKFKDPEKSAHTNAIEGMWSMMKRSLPQTNRSKKLFPSYLAEFMYRRMRKSASDPYKMFISDIIKIFNPARP